LWPEQPQRFEAGPFAIRMQSYFPKTCPANGSMSLPGRPFLLKVLCSAAGALRQRERVNPLNGIWPLR
jgi:hypothetical protein